MVAWLVLKKVLGKINDPTPIFVQEKTLCAAKISNEGRCLVLLCTFLGKTATEKVNMKINICFFQVLEHTILTHIVKCKILFPKWNFQFHFS